MGLLQHHLTGLARWNREISAGMFAWIELLTTTDSHPLIASRAVEQKVRGGILLSWCNGECMCATLPRAFRIVNRTRWNERQGGAIDTHMSSLTPSLSLYPYAQTISLCFSLFPPSHPFLRIISRSTMKVLLVPGNAFFPEVVSYIYTFYFAHTPMFAYLSCS